MCRVAEALFGVTPAAHRVPHPTPRGVRGSGAQRGPAPPPAGAGAPCTGLRRGAAPPAVRARVSVYVCAGFAGARSAQRRGPKGPKSFFRFDFLLGRASLSKVPCK